MQKTNAKVSVGASPAGEAMANSSLAVGASLAGEQGNNKSFRLQGRLLQQKSKLLQAMKSTFVALLVTAPVLTSAMTAIPDSQLSGITGQALLTADYIAPNSLGVADPNSSLQGGTMPIGFYRMGLDATVGANLNINKLQLGCGGFNNNIKVGCDIDLDYVSMMGLNTAGSVQPAASITGQKDATGASNNNAFAGAPVTSDFMMTRPFISIAVANPNDPTKREVVGFEFGAQTVSGYMGVGRVYQNGQTNQETGETCNSNNGQSLGCHAGINAISGYMHITLSGTMPVTNTFGNGNACFGQTTQSPGLCSGNAPATADLTGTRINSLASTVVASATISVLGIFNMNLNLPTTLTENVRFIHGFAVKNTGNFFLSFQRQQLAWPTYDKTGYSTLANAGWWMNIPDVQATNLVGASVATSGIPTSMSLTNIELKSVPPINCYGGYQYC